MKDIPVKDLPSFAAPPIVEVVCGIQFKPIDELSAPHLGLLWQSLQPEFPLYREMPPLLPVLESFPQILQSQQQSRVIDLSKMPSSRMWFMNQSESHIIQIQHDRFLTNWKKVSEQQQYPRYGEVFKFFCKYLDQFQSFLKSSQLSSIEPQQYELTYVNHIPQGDGWGSNEQIGNVIPNLARPENSHFLPPFETINWATTFVLPNELGRLHISAVSAVRMEDKQPILQLTLTVRGIDRDKSPAKMDAWFNLAREWIVKGFVDVTSLEIQTKVWRREK